MTLTVPSALAPAPTRSHGCVVRISGGYRLRGEVTVKGAKNATLPLLAATLLTEDPCVLDNVPDVRDVRIMIEVLRHLGAEVEWLRDNCLMIQAADIRSRTTPEDLATKMRASFLVMGPLLSRFGQASAPQPGGCAIGSRPVSVDVKGFAQLGAQVATVDERFSASGRLTGANLVLDYPSHTGTENLIMATVLADGITVIENASTEPEVLDLIAGLRSMGARIAWDGPATLAIQGVPRLHGTAFRVMPDRLEAATYLVAAAITGGDLTLRRVVPGHMRAVTSKLREVGAQVDEQRDAMRISAGGDLSAVSVQTYRYPGFPTDIQQPFAALLTQAEGESTVVDTVFDDRMRYLEELRKLGANAEARGQMAVIRGPTRLRGARVRALDLRAGASVVLAALAADGETVVTDAENIERGYTRFVETLADLGARCSTERVAAAD
jgi:UDP-N-acetylglucosamine 1-carboxyvinyltransferase